MDVLLKEEEEEEKQTQQEAVPSDNRKDAEFAEPANDPTPTTSAPTNEISSENPASHDNEELVEPISGQEQSRLNSHEQAVGA